MRFLRSVRVAGLATLVLFSSMGVLSGCGGETVDVGETLESDPRSNEDVMKRTEEHYRQQAQKQGRR